MCFFLEIKGVMIKSKKKTEERDKINNLLKRFYTILCLRKKKRKNAFGSWLNSHGSRILYALI